MKNLPTYEQYLLEQNSEKVFVFDFDDTLGVTDNPVGILHMIDGEASSDIESILTKDYNVPKDEILYIALSKKYIGGEIAYISSHGYKLYGNAAKKLRDEGKLKMYYGGESRPLLKGTEDLIDFSTSSYVNPTSTKPINQVIDVMKNAEKNGHEIGVITARKGKLPMKSIDGDIVRTTNVKDMVNFLHKRGVKTITIDDVYGAADFGNDIPVTKATLIVNAFIKKYNANTVNFYDDDRKNTDAADTIKIPNVDINTYNDDFKDGKLPKEPTNKR